MAGNIQVSKFTFPNFCFQEGNDAIFVRGCQEDRQRPNLFIGNVPSIIYGLPNGRHIVVEDRQNQSRNYNYLAFDQSCTTPLCNSWTDYRQTWGWIDWLAEAYTFHCAGLPAKNNKVDGAFWKKKQGSNHPFFSNFNTIFLFWYSKLFAFSFTFSIKF